MNNVICPITKTVMTAEACLAHSVQARPAPCGYDYILLKKMFESSDRSGIHTTDLLGCPKRTILTKTNPTPEPVPAMLTRVLGTLTHAILELDEDGALSELPVAHQGIVGTVDLYYPEQKTLIDLKTTRWLAPAKLPYGEHEWQVNIYAWMLEGCGKPVDKLFVQYIDMSGPTKCRNCKIYLQPDGDGLSCPRCGSSPKDAHMGAVLYPVEKKEGKEVEEFVGKRKATIEAGLETGFVDAEPSWLCYYCPHLYSCSEGLIFTKF